MTDFRTRQAPSPTGYLHFGTARQMLFTKLMAKAEQGTWYLRVEDTDRNRLNQGAVVNMLESLEKLGLLPDEGVTLEESGKKDEFYGVYQKGKYGPYIQSERLELYHEHAQKLIDKKLAYWSYLSDEEKQELTEIKAATKRAINYHKANLDKFGEEVLYTDVKTALADERKPSLRYHIQRNETIECQDELLGVSKFDLSLEEDFNILKSDGYPTYHLAHLIDDYLMETTLVIRAQEWYPSIARHVTMFRDYWGQEPKYMHLPFILGETGNKKLSKRDNKVNMDEYLEMGYLPEAIINYLAFLGWNPGTEKELYLESEDFISLPQKERITKLIDNIANEFSLERLSKSPARFNLEKLNWFNREYIKMLSLHEFAHLASQNKINQTHYDKNLRIGDYVYLVDTSTQKVFGNYGIIADTGQDGLFYPIGGGREGAENSIEALIREVEEESQDQVQVNEKKATRIADIRALAIKPYQKDDQTFDGKEMHLYFYPVRERSLKKFVLEENGEWEQEWHDLGKVIETNEFINYPIWQDFCEKNGIKCLEPTERVKQQYLSWLLDKNRITVLSEFGSESECILNWQQPTNEEIKWKKISEEDSLTTLKEFKEIFLDGIHNSDMGKAIQEKQDKLYNLVADKETCGEAVKLFDELVETWERAIKDWLMMNQKDTGSYLWPLRVTLSGKTKSPSPFELLAVLKKSQVEGRIEKVLS